ncbi:hypothetical protein [Terracoccus luteus]|uniref:Uncharacterized protein n=1 Tax=Terracoccus luteus TaxID=53356 RepID=A0A839Q1T4_9MICO|nr:hypothetical protein [Terracoccus luteus]MBB2987042.1 hypothetical protein [Terracoccus luteus]MCP2172693.1 hypothetical protein [Terracoccus luteus]
MTRDLTRHPINWPIIWHPVSSEQHHTPADLPVDRVSHPASDHLADQPAPGVVTAAPHAG